VECKQKQDMQIIHYGCFGILFGLSAQVNMAFIYDINTHLNENYKDMS
jgi:hypothetical protein